jgi:hypothetical protein
LYFWLCMTISAVNGHHQVTYTNHPKVSIHEVQILWKHKNVYKYGESNELGWIIFMELYIHSGLSVWQNDLMSIWMLHYKYGNSNETTDLTSSIMSLWQMLLKEINLPKDGCGDGVNVVTIVAVVMSKERGCCEVVVGSSDCAFTCRSFVWRRASHTVTCRSSWPIKFLFNVICEHFKVYFEICLST